MRYRHSLRFQGYWLSFIAWVMLSFATPLVNAVAEDSTGWMRLCSAHGVQWVSPTAIGGGHASNADCVCLSLGLSYQATLFWSTSEPVEPVALVQYSSIHLLTPFSKQQPRSPPRV